MSQNVSPINPGRPVPQKSKVKGWVIALIVGAAVLFLCILAVLILAVTSIFSSSSSSSSVSYTGNSGYIGVLHIEGTITSEEPSASLFSASSSYDQKFLLDKVDSLKKDPNNKGIMLFINTPGGEVYATDELYLKLEDYKASTGRPIYSYCASMAASGGYYLASASDKILMNRNCMTGSIGVTAGTYIDISGFLEKQGIKTTSIYVGKNKTMGSYFEGFTDEQKAIYMSILQETYDQFVQVVADGRGMSTADVEALADGRIYSPKQAVANGLVDEIMTYEDAQKKMLSDNSFAEDTEYADLLPETNTGLAALFGAISSLKQSDLDSYLSHLQMPVNGPAYYYEGLGS